MAEITNVAPQMGFKEAISVCFEKYADFKGRARRSEYWWFALFTFIIGLVVSFIPFVNIIVCLGIILPSWAVTVRRLHDTGRSGWWVIAPFGTTMLGSLMMSFSLGLVCFSSGAEILGGIFVIGTIVYLADIIMIIWLIQDGKPEANKYGPSPKYGVEEA